MDRFTDNEKACLLVSAIDSLGIKKRATLLSLFQSAGDIFTSYKEMQEQIVSLCGAEYFEKLVNAIKVRADLKLIEICEQKGIIPVTYYSENYPDLLYNIEPSPLVLFCKGDISLLSSELAIGVVGSRKCSRYGLDMAETFGADLAENGVVVVSGLARGIDGSAHEGALKVNGKTIAVLASGVDVIYPPEHRALYEKIVETGLVVSEYLPTSAPIAYRFPERNRIISGLSDGLLVVEAGEKSGALITLDEAIEQGKEIFILPSNVTSRTAKGSNEKLRSMPDALTLDADDVLRRFGKSKTVQKQVDSIQLDFMQEKIVELLETGERHFDELLELTELSAGELGGLLARMEVCGIIKDLGGNYYGI